MAPPALSAAPASCRSRRAAGTRDPRLVVIILRGAVDGLSAIPPVGDPDYPELHGELAFAASGERAALPLAGAFAAHPSLAAFKRMFDQKHATIVHAVATGYRDRSHFDGQDVLESGYPAPGRTDSGWLNRTLSALSGSAPGRKLGLGVGATAPLVIRGPAPALGWALSGLAPADGDLTARVLDLYAHCDPLLGERLRDGLAAEKVAAEGSTAGGPKKPSAGGNPVDQMRSVAEGAARLLATPDGPRVAALAFDGFDTPRTRARRRACSRSASRGWTPLSTPFPKTWATAGRRRSSSPSPNSDARLASTARTAPTTERARSRCSPAGRSPAAG